MDQPDEQVYGESERAYELETGSLVAPGVARADEVWTLTVRDAGLSNDGTNQISLVSITPLGLPGLVIGFESLSEPTHDSLFAVLCRAIAFPMSRRTPVRPWKLVTDSEALDAREIEKKLGIKVVRVGEDAEANGQAPVLNDHSCHGCGNMMIKVFRCGGCKGVNYCGSDCQTADWSSHKGICKQLKAAMDRETTSPRTYPFSFSSPTPSTSTPPISQILSSASLPTPSLFTAPICSQSFTFTDRLGLLDTRYPSTLGFPEQLSKPLDSLAPKTPFEATPAAITTWDDYLAACGMEGSQAHPWPLLLSFPLTIWHILAHVLPDLERHYAAQPLNRSKTVLKNGGHVTVHVAGAGQWIVELGPLLEFVGTLVRGATVDVFVVGQEIVVEPMVEGGEAPKKVEENGHGTESKNEEDPKPDTRTTEQNITAPQRAMLRKADHSIEFRSEKHESCVRVHMARSRYRYPAEAGSFPVDAYPPDIVLSVGSTAKEAQGDVDRMRAELRTAELPARFVLCVDHSAVSALESIRSLSLDNKTKRSKIWGPVENPFAQPLRGRRTDSDCGVWGNGWIWGWAC